MAWSEQEELFEGCQWMDLRESFHVLPERLYRQAGKASELLYFGRQHQYCGICGAPMEWASSISKRCTRCGEELWPKLNTAIIVLVRKGEEALLVKAKNFRRDYYGLVAGFVETGESLEECVAREICEETGLRVTNIRYFASQPWPYPIGLMIGFQADYAGGDIALRDGELRDAAFFTRDTIPAIPGKMSMARMLIDDWLENV
jgi:NAD+ diphosphatase